MARTGLGLQELVHLGLLVLRVPLRAERVTRALLPLHLVVYLLDDLLPLGRFGYHLTVRRAPCRRGGADDARPLRLLAVRGPRLPPAERRAALRERGAVGVLHGRVSRGDEAEGMALPARRPAGAWQRVHDRERAMAGAGSRCAQQEAFRQWLVERSPTRSPTSAGS